MALRLGARWIVARLFDDDGFGLPQKEDDLAVDGAILLLGSNRQPFKQIGRHTDRDVAGFLFHSHSFAYGYCTRFEAFWLHPCA